MRNHCAQLVSVRSGVLATLAMMFAVAAGPSPSFAAAVTWGEDDRHLHAEAAVELMFDEQSAAPSSAFAAWSDTVIAQPDATDPFSSAIAEQDSEFGGESVTASGGAGFLSGESLFWNGNAHSRMSVTFDLDAPMIFEFEGVLGAFGADATAWASATLWHEESDTFLIEEMVENDQVAFSLTGDMPAGTYEYELLASVDMLPLPPMGPQTLEGGVPGDELPLTAGAMFDSTTLVITPAPGAFTAGVVLLGAMLLQRRRRAAAGA